VAAAFDTVGLDWRAHVVSDPSLYRPTELAVGRGNPKKAQERLGWKAQYKMHDIVKMMVREEQNR
jgi:GDPmannose 4,6-dehydratase